MLKKTHTGSILSEKYTPIHTIKGNKTTE